MGEPGATPWCNSSPLPCPETGPSCVLTMAASDEVKGLEVQIPLAPPFGAVFQDDDAEMATRCKNDLDAFAPLYQRYRDRVYLYIRGRVEFDEDAADLTQQTFTKALTHIHKFRPQRGSFKTWLFAIARNAVVDNHRRNKPTGALSTNMPSGTADVEESAINAMEVEKLGVALAGLETKKRDLLALRFGAQLTVPEIAAITKTETDTVYKQIARALDELRGIFNERM